MRLSIVVATLSLVVLDSSGKAQDVGRLVEDVAEDLAVYVSAGQTCGLATKAFVNDLGAMLMRIDAKAFERGSMRGVMLIKGLESQGKRKMSEGARIARPKAELNLTEARRGVETMVKAADDGAEARADGCARRTAQLQIEWRRLHQCSFDCSTRLGHCCRPSYRRQ